MLRVGDMDLPLIVIHLLIRLRTNLAYRMDHTCVLYTNTVEPLL